MIRTYLQKISWAELFIFIAVSAVSAFAWSIFILILMILATLLFFNPDSFGDNTTAMFTMGLPYLLGIGFTIPGVVIFLWCKAVRKNPFMYLSIFYIISFIEIGIVTFLHKGR